MGGLFGRATVWLGTRHGRADDGADVGAGSVGAGAVGEGPPADGDDRGEVAAWVLITLMTAGLVVAIWLLAEPALSNVFDTAIQRVLDI